FYTLYRRGSAAVLAARCARAHPSLHSVSGCRVHGLRSCSLHLLHLWPPARGERREGLSMSAPAGNPYNSVVDMQARRFRGAVQARLGLAFDDSQLGYLAAVLQRRLDYHRRPAEAYLTGLECGAFSDEIGALARELTVGETYFFRHAEQFQALANV